VNVAQLQGLSFKGSVSSKIDPEFFLCSLFKPWQEGPINQPPFYRSLLMFHLFLVYSLFQANEVQKVGAGAQLLRGAFA
jgi:hypothetical protein